MTKIETVKKTARQYFDTEDWQYHVLKVVFYARQLAKKHKADNTVIELAAYLHDIARSKEAHDKEDHHIVGAKMAQKILTKNGFRKSVIDQVTHCIEAHRCKKDFQPKTIEAKIIANADAMSHFDIMPIFYFWRSKKYSADEITTWITEKLQRDWESKLTLPGAKQLVQKKYHAIKLLLQSLS
ncbi:MAG: HD domain-containing protein [Patescibacteria group bacterium]|jgi:uncharacterized protein